MQINYTAKTLRGETSAGVLDADTIALARQMLRDRGLFPLQMTTASDARTPVRAIRQSFFAPRVTKPELMLLTSQLVIMCRAGVDLPEALQNVSTNCRNPTLKQSLLDLYQNVAGGLSFSAAMKKQSHIFGEAYVASIAAGEASGKVPEVLARMSEMLRNEIKLQTTVKAAMTYPVVLMGVCVIVIAALLLFVLPNFERVFQDMGVTPPASTQMLLSLSGEIRRHLGLWVGVTIGAMGIGYRLFWTETVRRSCDNLAMRTAVLGEVLQSLVAGRLFVMLGTMLQSGVPLVQSLHLCRSAIRSLNYRQLLDDMQEEVLNGRGIGRTLNKANFVPAGVAQMVGTAEQSGKLGTVMQLVGEYYEAEGQRKIQELAKLLEPLIIIVMGVVVAFVVASIMLPMLDISTMAGQ
ncbi:MAG: type II secretion system F family protein [Planctomycetaceae bacterium]|nr:type II secretion system F family protein [Planctomycetaceae bacterium]